MSVAPGATLACAVVRPQGWLHVFFIDFDFMRYPDAPPRPIRPRQGAAESAAHFAGRVNAYQQAVAAYPAAIAKWQGDLDAWRSARFMVWKATLNETRRPSWQVEQVPGLGNVAGTAIAAAAVKDGGIHVIAQSADRASLLHVSLQGGKWTRPSVVPTLTRQPGGHDPRYFTTLCLAPVPEGVLFVGVDVEQQLQWNVFGEGRWGRVTGEPTTFSTGRSLQLVPGLPANGRPQFDIVGTSEEGEVVIRRIWSPSPGTASRGTIGGLGERVLRWTW